MSEWQPIETAPKDGSYILLSDREIVVVGLWGQRSTLSRSEWLSLWQTPESETFRLPTHWMVLPEPPQ